ncbi:3-phosphoshikimate 1-carboxyvinyltransferase [Opitutales bacterium]|nr:3-phosphoshikimate 1-carboxyvinyltransferase [Opitutales bacterium]
MNSILEIIPFTNQCKGSVVIPGSKSISNRALLLSCFSENKVDLHGVLKSQDVDLMISALKSVGIQIKEDWESKKLEVKGCRGIAPIRKQKIEVGNAGTVARFLTAWLAVQEQAEYSLDGSIEMRERPIGQLMEFFQSEGIEINYLGENGFFPFRMNTKKPKTSYWEVDASKSSQMLSALMMIAPLLGESHKIRFPQGTVSKPFLQITSQMIKDFTGDEAYYCGIGNKEIEIVGKYLRSDDFTYLVEPDATAASYFLTLPQIIGGSCEVIGVWDDMLQGDSKYSVILRDQGAKVENGPKGLISHRDKMLKGGKYDFNDISDTFLTLAAISPLLSTPLEIYGIAHTRLQETDRISAMTNELKKLGQEVTETEDSIEIKPNLNKLKKLARNKISIETYEDHRVAMSFGILGSFDLFGTGEPWMEIKNSGCCSKTFPDFFEQLEDLRIESTTL